MTEEDDYPPKPNLQKFGILVFIMICLMIVYYVTPIIFPEEETICNPLDDECPTYQIIVHFIGYYAQTFTNSIPILIR